MQPDDRFLAQLLDELRQEFAGLRGRSEHDDISDLPQGEVVRFVTRARDRLNADLAGGNVYSKLDQKNVTAWLDLRNKAAHGEYDRYSAPQVGLLISSVRNFITRNPA
jgi:hypothetical protein